jgi:C-terminal processing protease CtpA/Prc
MIYIYPFIMKKFIAAVYILTIFLVTYSCKDPEPEPEPAPTENEIVIDWIWNVMTDIYLWADEVDQSHYPKDESDPETFFYSILNEKDRFSWIVDDYEELINSFNNISLSTGIAPYFVRLYDTDEVIVIVQYVSRDSPADLAGIKRGEIITDINGTTLTINNYIDLFYAENVELEFAEYTDGNFVVNGKKISLTALVIEENPIIHHEIFSIDDSKIGYIVYTGFSSGEDNKWIDSLDNVFADFKSQGITDLIMDIRYNSGGRVSVATHIASVIGPVSVPGNKNVFVRYQWNEAYQEYFTEKDGTDSENLVVFFEDAPSVNLDLADAYFLTGSRSASASELIVIGLEPYMNVTQIGDTTYGKFYGSITIPDQEKPVRHNWALQPLVFKFANSIGYTDFNQGLVPDIYIVENILDMKQFGDTTDPILARALEEITGTSSIVTKSAPLPVSYTVLPDPVRELKNRAVLNREVPFPRR